LAAHPKEGIRIPLRVHLWRTRPPQHAYINTATTQRKIFSRPILITDSSEAKKVPTPKRVLYPLCPACAVARAPWQPHGHRGFPEARLAEPVLEALANTMLRDKKMAKYTMPQFGEKRMLCEMVERAALSWIHHAPAHPSFSRRGRATRHVQFMEIRRPSGQSFAITSAQPKQPRHHTAAVLSLYHSLCSISHDACRFDALANLARQIVARAGVE